MKKATKAAGLPKRSHHRKKPAAATAPLPPPLDPVFQQPSPDQPNGGTGLLGSLGNLFHNPEPESKPQPMFSTISPGGSFAVPDGFSVSDPLSPEAEQILAGIPERIGGEDEPGAPADAGELGGGGLELMGDICDDAAAKATLEWVGDMLADWRKCEEYRDAGKRAGGAAKHWAKVVNTAWARFAPAMLMSLGSSWPGLIPAVAMTAVAFMPAVKADMAQGAQRKRRGLVETQGGPVPVASSSARRVGLVE